MHFVAAGCAGSKIANFQLISEFFLTKCNIRLLFPQRIPPDFTADVEGCFIPIRDLRCLMNIVESD
jgi:hypothetical protein